MATSVADVERVIRDLLGKYFAEHSLPMPAIKLANRVGARSLASCAWVPGSTNTVMEIQRKALADDKTLRRVLAHELIHHWQFLRTDQTQDIRLRRMGIRPNGHGADFEQYAARINAIAGPDYVTKTSDQSYDTSSAPAYYILVEPHRDRWGYTIAIRPSAAQKAVIADKRQRTAARLFKITDGQFLDGAPIKRLGGFSIPRSPERAAVLAALYATGKEASI